jgi:hypothetical protein
MSYDHTGLMLVDHVLNVSCFHPEEWVHVSTLFSGTVNHWLIYRNSAGFWAKGRPRGNLYHVQSIGQIWDLFIQAGTIPPQELLEDTRKDKLKQQEAEQIRREKAAKETVTQPRPSRKKKT